MSCKDFLQSVMYSDIDDCASSPCRNNGTCNDTLADYICQCPPPYKGKTCASSKLLVVWNI